LETAQEKLKHFLGIEGQLSEDEWNSFASIWEVRSYKRKEVITRPGDRERYLYFVLDGAQRVFHLSDDDKEATLVFTYPHSFGGVLDAFLLQAPSAYFFESLTASELLRCSHESFTNALKAQPALDAIIQQSVHQVLAGLLARMVELQSFSSEQKFRALLKRSPHVLQCVPQRYLANYLGVDPTNFSKLMNAVRV